MKKDHTRENVDERTNRRNGRPKTGRAMSEKKRLKRENDRYFREKAMKGWRSTRRHLWVAMIVLKHS